MSLRWTLRPRDALEAGYSLVFRYMCRRVAIFNFEAAAMPHAFATSERLSVAVRVIPRFARRMMIHPGDFVAYAHQSEGGTPQYYVRRVGAIAGGMLTTDEDGGEDGGFLLPDGQCWLMHDLPLADATTPDSRVWGPVALDSVVGRVVVARATRSGGSSDATLHPVEEGPLAGLPDIGRRPGDVQFWNSEEGDLMDASSPALLDRADAYLREKMGGV